MNQYCVGVDVGGTTVKCGIFTLTGVLMDKWEVPTRKEEDGKYTLVTNLMDYLPEAKLICTDTVENLTRTNTKRIRMIRDGKEEDFVFKGDLNQLFAGFAGHNIEDIVIEEPELDEIFMHYYEEEAK